MNRRDFLKTGALFAGAMMLDRKSFAQTVGKLGGPRLKIGVISDIHIKVADDVPAFEKALMYYRDQKVDGVLIAGDMADTGLTRQMKLIADAWFRVFPKDRLPNGQHVERLFVYGNHDMEGHTYNLDFIPHDERYMVRVKEALLGDRAGYWKKYWHEDFHSIYIKDVKGYKFVGVHWYAWDGTPGIGDFLEAHRRELEGTKPFFFFQHPHPKNTVYGPWAWGHDDGKSTEALSRFPNAVAFSGHSHYVLNDERSVWQGAFTSVGTASLSYTVLMGGRENVPVEEDPVKNFPSQMDSEYHHDSKQGMLMTVYDGHITLERRDFVCDEDLDSNWIIPVPVPRQPPFDFSYRAQHDPVPQFVQGDKVTVTRAMGKDRHGKEQMQTTVHFPNVLKRHGGVRAFDYEVALELQEVDVVRMACTKRVFPKGVDKPEDKAPDEVTCVFGEYEAPVGRSARFHVRPCNCFGTKGKEIVSDWIELK